MTRSMGSIMILPLALLVVLAFLPGSYAFGAGNIPGHAYLEGKAYRHGDIEDVLEKIAKAAGGGFLALGAKKFSPLDVKRVYFGNWLRDYSQAVDVGALKKVPLQTILNICMALGFLAHGYATGEFEVTKERLGCYLPTEHIDNPKGYADGEDARRYDPRLRGPVDPRELEVDPRTGMKNYIANEGNSWDTSKSLVRRVLEACIHHGRQARNGGSKDDEYEAYRLLGQALHTLEDFTAHSNWCELTLQAMGHEEVFAHVGRNVRIQAPNGRRVPILVTGTFGGSDFIHSLMGEAGDHLSEASVSDLNAKVNSSRGDPSAQNLRTLLGQIPGGGGSELSREMDDVDRMRAGPGGNDPSMMSPQELHDTLWKILSFRDSFMKKIEVTIDRIPGLNSLVEKLTNSINVFVFTTLEPYMKPILSAATHGLAQSSAEIVNSHDQLEVFNDPNASDPTHSFLSKDHFGLILNEPAGRVAQVIVENAVRLVVSAWDNTSMDTRSVTENILECLFHPAFPDSSSQIQKAMTDEFRNWFQSQGSNQREILNRLTADSVRANRNKRIGDNSTTTGHSHGALPDGGLQAVLAQHQVHVPGAQYLNTAQDLMSGKLPGQPGFGTGGAHAWRDAPVGAPLADPVSSDNTKDYGTGGGGQTYGHAYGSANCDSSYQSHNSGHHGTGGYPSQQSSYGGHSDSYAQQQSSYGQPGHQQSYGQTSYGDQHSQGYPGNHGASRPSFDSGNNYGQPAYGGSSEPHYGAPSYGNPAFGHGGPPPHDSGFNAGPGGYGHQNSGFDRPSYGSGAPQYGNFDGPPPHHPHPPGQQYGGPGYGGSNPSYGGNNPSYDGPPGGYRY
ncbi:hypothetical protein NliqN6_2625 [Naganishia liquefaciens]|uniref:Het-C-domain-containing protein n=1 Tax=Naganishia liquefaciens TaxID=104408 RepID=A0A8H3TSR9_9TREE|nr:hypothetical protein NliqN6_2625 [Naganishia liquefaciens]